MTIAEKTHELGKLIQEDARFAAFNEAKEAHDNNSELQALVGEFNLVRMNMMNEVNKEDKDDAKVNELQEKVQNLYGEIMNNEVMQNFMKANTGIEEMISEINGIINFYITGEEPGGCDKSHCASCGGGCH